MTSEQLELISADPQVMHGQAVIAETRVSVSVILDCLAAGRTAGQITAEYPAVTAAGVRVAAYYPWLASPHVRQVSPGLSRSYAASRAGSGRAVFTR